MILQKRQDNRGFTLLELLVVISIISVLIAMITTSYTKAQQKSRDLARKNDIKQIQNALELYKNDQYPQVYPADLSFLVPEYMKTLPVDPREKGTDGTWYDYLYTPGNPLSTYTLQACMENADDPEINGGACASGGLLFIKSEP